MLNLLLALIFTNCVSGSYLHQTNQLANRLTIVHLFEWKWKDIADECERFLASKGFGGVQISPPSENLIINLANGQRTWYERYQVMSYKLETRSGNQNDFLDMTTRCNKVGVRRCQVQKQLDVLTDPSESKWITQHTYNEYRRIYADVVFNHMTADHRDNIGTAGSRADFKNYDYPAVPYHREHFHYPYCLIQDYNDAMQVRNCQLLGLKDLNQAEKFVQNKIVRYINKLIRLGVAGIRVDAAKHMWPKDLEGIYKKLDDLNPEFGFAANTRPYIYQEVIYYGNEPIRPEEYTAFGDVTEFRFGSQLKSVFRGQIALKWLVSWGEQWGLMSSEKALVFIDNHDTQRGSDVLTYKEARAYKAATAFMLAHPYGQPRVMSSYFFDDSQQGPPSDNTGAIVSPGINNDDTCSNGWVCEHRWRQIYQMVGFKNAVVNTSVVHWWDNGNKQIAFGRYDKGFIVFNGENKDLDQNLQTGLPPGNYCDIISGKKLGDECSGKKIVVDDNGFAHFYVPQSSEDMHMAIHVGHESKILKNRSRSQEL